MTALPTSCATFGWQSSIVLLLMLLGVNINVVDVAARSPAAIIEGKQLFERNWLPNQSQHGDGLGPLFNGQSCVACHHQGGVGGGGDARFNAKTIGFDWLKITGPASDMRQTRQLARIRGRNSVANLPSGVSIPQAAIAIEYTALPSGDDSVPDRVARAISEFHPGFVTPSGGIVSTFTISHHGGTQRFAMARQSVLGRIPAAFSEHGGPVSAAEVRIANATPIHYRSNLGDGVVMMRARLYQRNTPSLFGSGLIDQITPQQVQLIIQQQERHPEISGRAAGRFGWRGNVLTLFDFCEQACANELGLATARAGQPADPTNPGYRNGNVDISDAMIESMAAFVAQLPAPERDIPSDSAERGRVMHGEQVFAAVGCAVCHVPDVGPAKGVYSDLLIHDMGHELMDLNPAVLVARAAAVKLAPRNAALNRPARPQKFSVPKNAPRTRITPRPPQSSYYGGGTSLAAMTKVGPGEFIFASQRKQQKKKRVGEQPHVTQEWRTPPLWGVRDSAPYMHDGRAETLLEAIMMHEGEAAPTRDRFLNMTLADRQALTAFLNTLVAPKQASADLQ